MDNIWEDRYYAWLDSPINGRIDDWHEGMSRIAANAAILYLQNGFYEMGVHMAEKAREHEKMIEMNE